MRGFNIIFLMRQSLEAVGRNVTDLPDSLHGENKLISRIGSATGCGIPQAAQCP
jgi:hypothetical protein